MRYTEHDPKERDETELGEVVTLPLFMQAKVPAPQFYACPACGSVHKSPAARLRCMDGQ